MTSHTIILRYTKKILHRAVFRFVWRAQGWSYWMAISLLMICNLIRLTFFPFNISTVALLTGTALIFLLQIITYTVHYCFRLEKLNRMGPAGGEFIIGDADFTIGATVMPWQTIRSVWRYDDMWLVILGRSSFFTVPLHNVSDIEKSLFLSHVQQTSGRIH